MNIGPLSSSSTGGLITCTCPQRWPMPLPRSRNHRPPGHCSRIICIDSPLRIGVAFAKSVQHAAKDVADVCLDFDVLFDVQRHLFDIIVRPSIRDLIIT